MTIKTFESTYYGELGPIIYHKSLIVNQINPTYYGELDPMDDRLLVFEVRPTPVQSPVILPDFESHIHFVICSSSSGKETVIATFEKYIWDLLGLRGQNKFL